MQVELIYLCLLYSRSTFKKDHFQFCSDGTGLSISTQGWKHQHAFKFFISFLPKCRIFVMDYLKYEMLKCFVK